MKFCSEPSGYPDAKPRHRRLAGPGARSARCLAGIGLLALCTLGPARGAEPATATTAAAPSLEARRAAVATVVDHAVAHGLAGEVLVGDAQRVWFERAAGLADTVSGLPHRSGEVWRWASVSKQVAALLTMQEVEAGRLQLDDTLALRLPDFKARHAQQITLRDLLRHTSGLANPDDSPPAADGLPGFYRELPGPSGVSLADRSLAWCAGTPKSAPGPNFSYNNCDTLVLGAVLERSSGLPYADLVRQRLAQPLGARHLRLVTGAESSPVRAFEPGAGVPPQPQLATFGASGALEGTAQELLDFDRGLLAGRWLSADATRTMWAGEPKLGYVALGAWAFPARLAGCSAPVDLVERRGDIGGIQVRNLIAPALGQVIVVFSNNAALEFGEIWQGRGLMHDLAAAALCGTPQPRS